jgi:hypothetical protein
VEWYRNYVGRERSDIAQELADFRASLGGYFSTTFDLQLSVTLVALKIGTVAPHSASLTRIRNGVHPTIVGERRPIMMQLKMMCATAALGCAQQVRSLSMRCAIGLRRLQGKTTTSVRAELRGAASVWMLRAQRFA